MALQRVSIAFSGFAHVLSVRMEDESLDGLLQALASGGWHDLTVEDGTIRVNLNAILYVRTERHEHRVGFGAG